MIYFSIDLGNNFYINILDVYYGFPFIIDLPELHSYDAGIGCLR